MTEIILALGSNIEPRKKYLQSAIERLTNKIQIERTSSWYENPAIGGPSGQGDFLNGTLHGHTELSPEELLIFIKKIEQDLGRDLQAERWSARVIDIDIIFYGREVINSTELTIPHSRMHIREFVLIPLCEIYPNYPHPVLEITARELLDRLVTGNEAEPSF